MTEAQDTKPAEKDGKYQFTINYSGRDVTCQVIKEQQMLHVTIDGNMNAELKLNADGSLTQTDGAQLPESSIEFIKKQIFGHGG